MQEYGLSGDHLSLRYRRRHVASESPLVASVRMRSLLLLPWLLRSQVIVGLVQFIGLFVGFAWPPPVWSAHRLIAVVAPAVALFAFRRSAWTSAGRPAPLFTPGVRVAARFALLAPLALGLCFSTGVLGGRRWIVFHIALAIGAMMIIERATASAPISATRTTHSNSRRITNE